jgi:hypothetical protein
LPLSLTLEEVAAGGAAWSTVASVITTTTNTLVDSANSAVSIGRWSNLAIIAFSLYLGFGRSQCGRSGRDRPFAPWSMLFAGDREKARVLAPTFRRSPNGCRGRCSFTEQARIRKAGPTPTERRSQAVNATQQGGVRVGIDVSKRTLDVCLLPEGESFVLPNDQEGVEELLSRFEDSPPNWSSSRPPAATSVWPLAKLPSRPPQSPSRSSTPARPATSPRPSADSPAKLPTE